MSARRDWGGQKVDCIGRNVSKSTGEKTLVQHAGRQGETLPVKVAIHNQMTPREEHFILRDCLGKQLW